MNEKSKLKEIIEQMYEAKENPSEEKLLELQKKVNSFEDDSEFTEHLIKFDLIIAKYYLTITELAFEKNKFQDSNITFNNVINFISQIKFLIERNTVDDKIKLLVMDWGNKVDKWRKNSDYYYSLNIAIEEKIEGVKKQIKSIKKSSDIQKLNLMIQEAENLCEELTRFIILEHVYKFGGYLSNDISFIDADLRKILEQHLDERIRNYENKLIFEMGQNEYLRAKMDKLIEYPIEKDIRENKEIYREDHIYSRIGIVNDILKKKNIDRILPFINFVFERTKIILNLKEKLFLKKLDLLKDEINKISNDEEKYKISIDHVKKELKEFKLISYIENLDIEKDIVKFESSIL